MLKWGCGEDSRTEASGAGYLAGPGVCRSVTMGGRRSSPGGKQALGLGTQQVPPTPARLPKPD